MSVSLIIPESTALAARSQVERMTGIEPALSAWEADVLPLNYIRRRRVARQGRRAPRSPRHIVQEQGGCSRAPHRKRGSQAPLRARRHG